MKFKIAVVQFKINLFSSEINLTKAEKFIQKAVFLGCPVIIFPEDFVTGPVRGRKELVDFDGKYRKYFQALARQYKIDVITGSLVEGSKIGWFNTTYYIDARGKVRAKYRKINLWLTERNYLMPGNEISVFNTKYGKAGLIICWDLVFPEVLRAMVKRGVRIVYCPSFWMLNDASIGRKYNDNAEKEFINSVAVSRAFENEIILVWCNAAGSYKIGKNHLVLAGQSQITAPFIGVIKKLNHNKEEMFVQEIDTNILKDAERAYRIRHNLKTRI
ncbi:MAG: hypothetical protein A3J46_02875 [Candidatus Yanofskybacteria bacterium RIFCSPHIGHO2_02_FULL_41_11]|uniref:CN hydrolase domain-containing protein n=1 Tax=Candidatus Yanofskybacteria bacterium RIFCSPHIGHO2_02_FULL_41_11 TaxID=1802675 RepID=A0A1F8F648_9BACT|nr:MAG: hypothetical protein A3J46_02875 [Candidatus Yanofskybacteria bacterium RIFCSPHIGHO2_02_FULL_41_11]